MTSRPDSAAPAGWWRAAEEAAVASPARANELTGAQRLLAQALRSEIELDFEAARRTLDLARAEIRDAPWTQVLELLDLWAQAQVLAPDGLGPVRDRAAKLRAALPASDTATRSRVDHLLGWTWVRAGDVDAAERHLGDSIAGMEDAPGRLWALQTLARVHVAQGMRGEASRLLRNVVARKSDAGDAVGVAIGSAALAMHLMRQGATKEAVETVRGALRRWETSLPEGRRLRLRSLLVEGLLETGQLYRLAFEVDVLRDLIDHTPNVHADSRGFDQILLARVAAALADAEAARSHLARAEQLLALPAQGSVLRYWRARLLPDSLEPGWLAAVTSDGDPSPLAAEYQVRLHLLAADRLASEGDPQGSSRHLRAAAARARSTHDRVLLDLVTGRIRDLDLSLLFEVQFPQRTLGGAAAPGGPGRDASTAVAIRLRDTAAAGRAASRSATALDDMRTLLELAAWVEHRDDVSVVGACGPFVIAVSDGEGHAERAASFGLHLQERIARHARVRAAIDAPLDWRVSVGTASGRVDLAVEVVGAAQQVLAVGPAVEQAMDAARRA